MYYTLIGILALLILIITNHDVFFHWSQADATPVQKTYRRFHFGIMAYYVTDMLWGILDYLKLRTPLYLDTELYFIAMALGILLWAQYVVAYLEENDKFSAFLHHAGIIFFTAEMVITFCNFFIPVMFWFDEEGVYHTGFARNFMLVVQIILLLLTSIYAVRGSTLTQDGERNRYRTIGLFGIIMVIFLSIQYFNPYLPLYSIAYMLGSCLLRTFVIENEKDEYQRDLEASLNREKQQLAELVTTRKLAYTDALTHVKSKLAYMEKEEETDKEIANGTKGPFAIVAFDVNGLKYTNDNLGHDEGDRLLVNASKIICDCFDHSPVYRTGGDEFVAILEGQDYENREALMSQFNAQADENIRNDEVVVSGGIADYRPQEDNSFDRVFIRADEEMYKRKEELKKIGVYKR